MNLSVGLQHELNVSQDLSLAPHLLQWLRILQVSTTDLAVLVQAELETNPALELDKPESDTASEPTPAGDDLPANQELELNGERLGEKLEYLAEIDQEWRDEETSGSHSAGQSGDSGDAQEINDYIVNSVTRPQSLQEHLTRQLRLMDHPVPHSGLSELIIGSLDERGYLVADLGELASLSGETPAVVEQTLNVIQSLDPAGVGARNLRECLLLQLRAPDADPLARVLVDTHLHALARKQYGDLAELLKVKETAILQALQIIRALNPAPGQQFVEHRVEPVEPDVVVYRRGKEYVVELTDQRVPRLRLSNSCHRMLKQQHLKSEEITYIQRKIRAAAFMIQGIRQRQETLKKTVEHVVRFQQGFLDQTTAQPDALTMATVARLVGVHETTVSRAIANKYAQTPCGIFPLRHFFRTGIRCADGSRMTPQQVMQFMTETIRQENPQSPRLDRDIVQELGKRGLRIARRTVSKYRDELGIPTSKDRKRTEGRPTRPATPSSRKQTMDVQADTCYAA